MKDTRLAKLGFNKRELSNINVDTIEKICFQVNFDEEKYNQWFRKVEIYDEFVAQNVENRARNDQRKKSKSRDKDLQMAENEEHRDWIIDRTPGEKHCIRIKKRNA